MKSLFLFNIAVIILSVAVLIKCDDAEDAEMLRSLSKECQDKENASDDDVTAMVDKKLPETKEGKCLLNCLQTQFGICEEMQFKPDAFYELCQMKVSDEETLKKIRKVADDCVSVTHADRCEFSWLLAKCLADKSTEYGVSMDN